MLNSDRRLFLDRCASSSVLAFSFVNGTFHISFSFFLGGGG